MLGFRRLRPAAVLSGAVACLALAAGAAVSAPSPLDRLNVWEGHWRFKSERKETRFSHAGVEVGAASCAWQPNRGYLTCEFLGDAVDPDEGIRPDNLAIYYYSSADKAYHRVFMTHDGGSPMNGTIVMDANAWTATYEIPRRSGGTALLRDSYVFATADKQPAATEVSVKSEVSIDKGAHWTEITQTLVTKVT